MIMLPRRGSVLLVAGAVALTGLSASVVPAARAGEATVLPAADGYVDASSPGSSYGALTRLRVDSDPAVRSHLRFDLSSVGEAVSRAVLDLTPTSALAAGFDVRAVQEGTTWTEGGLTFATAPQVGQVVVSSGPVSTGNVVSLDVTALVRGTTLDLALTGRSTIALSLASRESATPPVLRLDTLADPAPVNQVPPALSGTAQQGKALVVDPGIWLGAVPLVYSFSWRRCDDAGTVCEVLAGESGSAHTLTTADEGHRIVALVTATNGAGSATAPSAPSAVVVPKPAPSRDQVVLAAGDIACGDLSRGSACRQQETAELLVAHQPDAVLPLGDTQYECGDPTDFTSYYGPSWGRALAVTRPVPGNHEYTTTTNTTNNCYNRPAGAPGYYGYFGDAASPAEPGCRVACRGYYSYDLGDWHLIALNSNCGRGVACAANGPQGTWLQADLQAHTGQCTLAYYHHPRWSSGQEGPIESVGPLVQLLYDAGVDVVLNGHDHDYERFAPMDPAGQVDPVRGMREFVVGTGGRNLTSQVAVANGSEVRDASTFGVLKLVLAATSYRWEFLPVTGSGPFRDAGSQPCHSAPATDRTPPSAPAGLVGAAAGPRVDLDWDAARDDVGVVAHRLYRDGALLATAGDPTGYADATAGFGTVHTYALTAVDAAGNESLPSGSVRVVTRASPAGSSLLEDGFETGTLTAWSSANGLQVQRDLVDRGRWAARSVAGPAGSSYASALFPQVAELWARERVQLRSQGSALALLRLRNALGTTVLTVQLSSKGLLQYVDEVHAVTRTSTVSLDVGGWHTLDLHAVVGSPGRVELSLDGVAVLAGDDDLGLSGLARVYVGETNSSHTGEQIIDEVYVGTVPPPVPLATSLAPTAGTDATGASRDLTPADLSALEASDGVRYAVAGAWGGSVVGTTADLTGSTCWGEQTCWAVGAKGVVVRTQDRGRSWSATTVSNRDLTAVAFVDANRGLAVGQKGAVLQSTDGGWTWQSRTSGTTKDLAGVAWTDTSRAVAVGQSGTVLTSDDGGGTWRSRTSGTGKDLAAVTGGPSVLAVGQSGTVLRSTDGGASWRASTAGSKDLAGVAVAGTRAVAVGTSGTVQGSTDTGLTWRSATSAAQDLTGAAAVDGRFWVSGKRGTVLTSTDGATFTSRATGTTKDLWAVAGAGPLLVVGQSATVRLSDDGVAWWAQPPGALTWAFDAQRSSVSAVGLALDYTALSAPPTGTSAVLRTTVDGTTWTSSPLPVPATSGTSVVIDLTDLVAGDPARLAALRVSFVVTTPPGSTLRTAHDLVRLQLSP